MLSSGIYTSTIKIRCMLFRILCGFYFWCVPPQACLCVSSHFLSLLFPSRSLLFFFHLILFCCVCVCMCVFFGAVFTFEWKRGNSNDERITKYPYRGTQSLSDTNTQSFLHIYLYEENWNISYVWHCWLFAVAAAAAASRFVSFYVLLSWPNLIAYPSARYTNVLLQTYLKKIEESNENWQRPRTIVCMSVEILWKKIHTHTEHNISFRVHKYWVTVREIRFVDLIKSHYEVGKKYLLLKAKAKQKKMHWQREHVILCYVGATWTHRNKKEIVFFSFDGKRHRKVVCPQQQMIENHSSFY